MFTFFLFFLLASATAGVHRLYNYESVFEAVRRVIGQRWWLKPVWCAKCNIFWIALTLVSAICFLPSPWGTTVLVPFAVYPWVRGLTWVYAYVDRVGAGTRVSVEAAPTPITAPPPVALKPGCTSCTAAEETKKEQGKNLSYKKRFVLMTMFGDFKPSYSLTSVVADQARMLASNPEWLVQIWVLSTCNLDDVPKDLPTNVEIRKILPPIPLPTDRVDEKGEQLFFGQALHGLMVLGNATIIAHDLLFIDSFTTVASAIHRRLGVINGFRWFHFCHSAPAAVRPEGLARELRATLPAGHTLLCLAESQADALAAYYGTTRDRVRVVPNARDIRSTLGISPRAAAFISKHKLVEADIVQVLPLSTPRAAAKGLSHVIAVFAELTKSYGLTVRLVIPNAHANGNGRVLAEAKAEAQRLGLTSDALIFTSDSFPELASPGLPTADVQALFQVSNVFVFPTLSEACSMTLMEAALAGCLLVLNKDVPSLLDIISDDDARYVSWNSNPTPASIASLIYSELRVNRINRSKRSVLRAHSLDAIGARLRAAVA